jgi:hypothetical protein
MQAGNDFLPSIPSLEIYGRPSGLDVLVRTYKELLPALGGPITNGSIINPDRLKRILSKLAEDEEDAFQRLAVSLAVFHCAFCIACKPNTHCDECSHVDRWAVMLLTAVYGFDIQHMDACYTLLQCAVFLSNEHGSAAKTASKLRASGTLHTKAEVGKSLKLCFAVHAWCHACAAISRFNRQGGCVMQMRKARDFQRLAERENEGQGGVRTATEAQMAQDSGWAWVSCVATIWILCWEAWEEVNSSLTIRQCKFGNAPDPNSLL